MLVPSAGSVRGQKQSRMKYKRRLWTGLSCWTERGPCRYHGASAEQYPWDYPALSVDLPLYLCLHRPHQAGLTFLYKLGGCSGWWAWDDTAVHCWRTHNHCWSPDHQPVYRGTYSRSTCQSIQRGGASSLYGWAPRVFPYCSKRWGASDLHQDWCSRSSSSYVGQNYSTQSVAGYQAQ
jgi:hypothetical protein